MTAGAAAAALAVTGAAGAGPAGASPAHAAAQPSFGWAQGWRVGEHLRELADVNGDGRADVVGFGDPGTFTALGRADGTFTAPVPAVADFGSAQGWAGARRTTGDVDGDGRDDLVGFGARGVQVAYAQADGTFTAPEQKVRDFGRAQGWTPARHVREVADVDGDGVEDVVGFGTGGTWVALGRTDRSFAPARRVLRDLGWAQGWRPGQHPRLVADVDGDGAADLVGFGAAGTWMAWGRADGTFTDPVLEVRDFGTDQGWRTDEHVRTVGDVSGDGRADVVGLGHRGVQVARSTGDLPLPATFHPSGLETHDLATVQGWRTDRHPRVLADVTGDGADDVVGFGDAATLVIPGNTIPLRAAEQLTPAFGRNDGWTPARHLRLLGDVDGDGADDVVGFGRAGLSVRLS
ncbi:hypothetical protein AUQ48_14715 [Kocuria flava]|uniref:Esterase n=1 Tax=Kocuria flava TaxID=446860 RepID=A0A2N4T4U0_9MICC|nr:VCBS repeat-containing protein [Kocuria flava]PLC13234.1 hypothetical protein AUQ48_14715 [Kocuria flava]